MAVFTAIAAVITGAISGAGFAAAFAAAGTFTALGLATSVLAAGIAVATAKATGVFKAPGLQQGKDPGVKVQLAPSTDNRIPVFYGRNVTGAIAVDAEIKNQNNTMVYVMVIGEKTDTGSYSINKIYRGDATLNFGTSFSSHVVQSITDPNATASNAVQGKMRCRVYAGNAQSSANQIFPTTGTPVAAQTLCSTITANTNYEDLVYAIFELDYDPENGLTQLGSLTFDITNSLKGPANVLLDYLQNDRYGAGLSSTEIDLVSFDDLHDHSNILGSTGNVSYRNLSNVVSYHDRYEINGMLSTYVPVKDNIDQICQGCSTFFTYDPKGGKFKVVPNRAATTAEKANAFIFNDDVIVSEIKITSTELYSLYNQIEAEYPEVNKKDQTNIVIVDTPASDRNANEPDNPLSTRINLVNDYPRVYNLANIDLNQSRTSTVLEFDADYSAIQVDVGDVVKVTNAKYGYTDKLFRVMRVTEKEAEDGMLTVGVILLEYADAVYVHSEQQSQSEPGVTGIPGWWTNISNTNITYGNIIVIDDPNDANANVVDSGNGNVIANIDWGNIDWPILPPNWVPGQPWFSIESTIGNNVHVDEAIIEIEPIVDNQSTNTPNSIANTIITIPAPTDPVTGINGFPIDTTFNLGVPTTGLGSDKFNAPSFDGVNIASISFRDSMTGATTNANTEIANITVNPGGYISTGAQGDLAPGTQIEDQPPNNVNVVDSSTTSNVAWGESNSYISDVFEYDITGIDEGEFSIIASTTIAGAPSGPFDASFAPWGNVIYEEKYSANNQPTGTTVLQNVNDGSAGVQYVGIESVPQLYGTTKIDISNAAAAAIVTAANGSVSGKVYTPLRANVQLVGNTSIPSDPANSAPRAFINQKFDVIRLTKGDNFY